MTLLKSIALIGLVAYTCHSQVLNLGPVEHGRLDTLEARGTVLEKVQGQYLNVRIVSCDRANDSTEDIYFHVSPVEDPNGYLFKVAGLKNPVLAGVVPDRRGDGTIVDFTAGSQDQRKSIRFTVYLEEVEMHVMTMK